MNDYKYSDYKCSTCGYVDIWFEFFHEEIVPGDGETYPMICPQCGRRAHKGENEKELFIEQSQ